LCTPVYSADIDISIPPGTNIMVLGEYHDNPSHHQIQADFAARLQPRALVFEMLTAAQAKRAAGVSHGDMQALETALGWQGSGWSSFEHYFPIFAAAPEAAVFGAAVPRAQARLRTMQAWLTALAPKRRDLAWPSRCPSMNKQRGRRCRWRHIAMPCRCRCCRAWLTYNGCRMAGWLNPPSTAGQWR